MYSFSRAAPWVLQNSGWLVPEDSTRKTAGSSRSEICRDGREPLWVSSRCPINPSFFGRVSLSTQELPPQGPIRHYPPRSAGSPLPCTAVQKVDGRVSVSLLTSAALRWCIHRGLPSSPLSQPCFAANPNMSVTAPLSCSMGGRRRRMGQFGVRYRAPLSIEPFSFEQLHDTLYRMVDLYSTRVVAFVFSARSFSLNGTPPPAFPSPSDPPKHPPHKVEHPSSPTTFQLRSELYYCTTSRYHTKLIALSKRHEKYPLPPPPPPPPTPFVHPPSQHHTCPPVSTGTATNDTSTSQPTSSCLPVVRFFYTILTHELHSGR